MKSLTLALAIIATLSPAAGPAAAQTVRKPAEPPLVINDPDPAEVVRELYRAHRNGDGHVFGRRGRGQQQKFFDAKLAGLIWKNLAETPEGEPGRIDFDPLFNAQDARVTNFRVGEGAVKGGAAAVPVTFVNFGRRVRLHFRLVMTKGVWKISNIVYGGGSDLLAILSAPM